MSEQQSVDQRNSNWVAILAVLLVVASLLAYYGLVNQSMILRLVVLFGGILASIAMVAVSSNGKRFIAYSKDSWSEVRKVVWPTRKETTQMTMIVFAFVAIMSIFLWSSDKFIEWLIFSAFLGWK